MPLFLQKTASDSVAVWMPSNNSNFIIPIILSTGVGVNNFFNVDQPPNNIILRQSLNRNVYAQVKPVTLTGTTTFHPQSSALAALREVLEWQIENGISVFGTGIIINAGAALMDQYNNMLWSSPYPGVNRNKVMSDVPLAFSSSPPKAVSVGTLTSLGLTLSGLFG